MALTRAVVGGKVTAAITNGIIDQVEKLGRHIEWTATSGSTGSGGVGQLGTLVLDAANSNNTTFAAGGVSSFYITDAGSYALDVVATVPVNVTGLTYIRWTDGLGGQGYQFGQSGLNAIAGALSANLTVPAATTITLTWFHTSAAARVLTSRIRLTRVA